MTTAEQPPPEGDKQPPQAASVDEPESGSGTGDPKPKGDQTSAEE